MKIAHFVSSFNFGGIEQHIFELATVQMQDNEILIICNEYLEPFYKDKFNVIKIKNFSRRNIFQRYKLKEKLKTENIDILHTHGTKTTSIISKINNKIVKQINKLKINRQIGYLEESSLVADIQKTKIHSQNEHNDVFAEVEKLAYKLIKKIKQQKK